MSKDIRDIVSRIKKLYFTKVQPFFYLYRTYIVISIFLGTGLEFKLFDKISDKPVQLINHFLNTSSSSPIDHSLVFSTSASILSTVFTIIFVLLTVFIQMSGEYTSAYIFHNKETKNLMRLYFGTIVLSLMMLETTFQFPILVLTLTFACILSLYPFLYSLSNKLVYDVGVKNLSEEISSLIDSNNEDLAISKIYSLESICKRSIIDNRRRVFRNILITLETNTQKAKDKKMTRVIEIIGIRYLVILDLLIAENSTTIKENPTTNDAEMIMLLFGNIRRYAENYSEMIPCISLNYGQTFGLKEAGIKMMKGGFKDTAVNQIVEILFCTFKSLQKKRKMDNGERENLIEQFETDIVQYIGELAEESFQFTFKLSFKTSMTSLFKIGAKVLQAKDKSERPSSSILCTIIKQLLEIENIIGVVQFEKLYISFKNNIFAEPALETYLDDFKKAYGEAKKINITIDICNP